MKLVIISSSNVGTKTRTVMERVAATVMAQDPGAEVNLIDLAEVLDRFVEDTLVLTRTTRAKQAAYGF